LYAWQDKCPCPEITNYIVKHVSNRSFVDRISKKWLTAEGT
jgi:hypothetical protein